MLLRASTSLPPGYRNRLLPPILALVLVLGFSITLSSSKLSTPPVKPGLSASTFPSFGNLPLSFEPNVGQSDPSAHFIAHASGSTLYFAPSEVVLVLTNNDERQSTTSDNEPVSGSHPVGTRNLKSTAAVRLQFVGANPSPLIRSGDAMPGKVNYFIGKDPARWHTDLPTYRNITYSGLYPGVNLLYSGTGGQLKGTYNLAPDADPTFIRWRYTGAEGVTLDDAGNLQITLQSKTTVTEQAPATWQEMGGERVAVSSRYVFYPDGSIGFALGKYDRSQPLTIDPTLTYSTYLGGFYEDGAGDIALDAAGNMYVTGATRSTDFPLSNPFQPVQGGQYDAFVTKLSPDGSTLIYSTFLGGSGEIDGGDFGVSISVDTLGNVIVGGSTDADNFPTTPGAYQTSYAGTNDLFISKLNAAGSALIFSTYYGDDGVEEAGAFTTDAAGNTYFTGYFEGAQNSYALLGEMSANGSQLLFVRSLGGHIPGPGDQNANTHGRGIVLDPDGNIYVTGDTRAADFPTTPGAYRTTIRAFEDGFVTKLTPSGQTLIYSTYIPGGVSDYPSDIALDSSGNAYVTGNTNSSDFPTTPGAFQTVKGDTRIAFVTKFNPTGSALVYSTFLGDTQFHFATEDYGHAIRVNSAGSAYVVGYTNSAGFPLANPLQSTLRGPYDAFVTKFNPAGSALVYSTFLGGSAGDVAGGLALDNAGHAYVVGGTRSIDFPLANPIQPTNHGRNDAFIVKIADEATTATPTQTGTPPTNTPTRTPACGGVSLWRTETPMPIPYSHSVAAVYNNQLYVIGGASNSPTPVRHMQRFDPASNSWTTLPPSPNGVAYMGAVAIGTKIYVMGGTDQPYQIFMQIYDTFTGTWSRGATLPEPLAGGAFAEYGGKIYLFGGQYNLPSNHVYEYDPATDTYTAKAPMPSGQTEIGAATIGNRIYVVGGYQYIHYAYDPIGNSWTTIATALTPSFSFPGVFALNGELWVEGGYDNPTRRGYPPAQEVQIYNPLTNSWRFGPAFTTPRYFSTAAAAINGRGYIVGGIDLNSNNYPYDYLNSMESIAYLPCGTITPTAIVTPAITNTPTGTSTGTPGVTGTRAVTMTGTPNSTLTMAPTTRTTTPCPMNFSDVQPTDYFYEAVRYLYCAGVISGYADGTFRPYNNTTRGQLCKIVVLAEGFALNTSGGPHFSDVPLGSPFYAFVETAYNRTLVSGYGDGTFRPGNNVTRGQLSKIVVLAMNWTDPCPSAGHFSDVPPGSPFFCFVETAFAHNIISGYSDGTFRPGNNATRGQICKIVYQAVSQP